MGEENLTHLNLILTMEEYFSIIGALDTIAGTRKVSNFLEQKKDEYVKKLQDVSAQNGPVVKQISEEEALASAKTLMNDNKPKKA